MILCVLCFVCPLVKKNEDKNPWSYEWDNFMDSNTNSHQVLALRELITTRFNCNNEEDIQYIVEDIMETTTAQQLVECCNAMQITDAEDQNLILGVRGFQQQLKPAPKIITKPPQKSTSTSAPKQPTASKTGDSPKPLQLNCVLAHFMGKDSASADLSVNLSKSLEVAAQTTRTDVKWPELLRAALEKTGNLEPGMHKLSDLKQVFHSASLMSTSFAIISMMSRDDMQAFVELPEVRKYTNGLVKFPDDSTDSSSSSYKPKPKAKDGEKLNTGGLTFAAILNHMMSKKSNDSTVPVTTVLSFQEAIDNKRDPNVKWPVSLAEAINSGHAVDPGPGTHPIDVLLKATGSKNLVQASSIIDSLMSHEAKVEFLAHPSVREYLEGRPPKDPSKSKAKTTRTKKTGESSTPVKLNPYLTFSAALNRSDDFIFNISYPTPANQTETFASNYQKYGAILFGPDATTTPCQVSLSSLRAALTANKIPPFSFNSLVWGMTFSDHDRFIAHTSESEASSASMYEEITA